MKSSDTLESFYLRRKSLILRFLIFAIIILGFVGFLIQSQGKEDFIAKVYLEGIIQDKKELISKLENLNENKYVKGLMTVINSPGGTYVGSKEVYDAINSLSKKIPTVVYMKEMATSGGYLVSLSSDKIFSNEGTLTGSIGVILQTANISKLLNKIGINPVIIKSGELKAVPNPAEKIGDKELQYLQDIIKKMQNEFIEIVKFNREISNSTLELISDGRVFTGKDAKKLALIDEIGNESDAFNWLIEKAEVDKNIKVKDLSSESNIRELFSLRFFKKKINYFNQNFYNGIFAIWMPGI